MPELMNSVRAPRRWIDAGARRSADLDRAALLLLAAACTVLFSLSFVLGRVLSPAGPASQGPLPRIAAVHAGEVLPVSLTAAPAILPGVAVAPVAPAKPGRRGRVTASQRPAASVVLPSPAAAAPPAPVPASTAPVAAPPVKAPERTKAPVRQTRSAPAPSKHSGGGGVSFDSSG